MSAETSVVRVGLIGVGKMGLHHLKAMAATPLARIVGVADPAASEDDLRPLLPSGAVVVKSAAELYAQAKPDVVHIVTPPHTHEALALEAIAAGCHVYIEKPFTPTAAAAARVLDAARARGLKVCAGHQVLFEAPALAAIEQLPQIGELVNVESYFSFRMVRRTITPAEQVKDILPHAVYPVVEQVYAATRRSGEPFELAGLSVDPSGEAYALLRLGGVTAIVIVTLNGRPVEQYQYLSGTNGSLRADFIGGFLGRLIGPGTGPGVLLTPYRRAYRAMTGTTRGITKLVLGGSYPGLRTITHRFYQSIVDRTPAPLSDASILETVRVCELIGDALDASQANAETAAKAALADAERVLAPTTRPLVVLTGGTGLLGRRVAEELRLAGHPVRVLARRVPLFSRRLPGVDYVAADLARDIDPAAIAGAGYVVHAAAETSGGKDEHRKNSIDATRRLLEAAKAAGAKGFLHISSLAVLKTSKELGRALDEQAPVDAGNLKRGPYVWGKAESEVLAREHAATLGLPLRIVRPGPLVDYTAFQPPGRLGREIGPWFVGIGPKRGALSVCDVTTASKVVRSYLADFEAAPPLLNLVEAPPPTRGELLDRYRRSRSDLRPLWFPGWLLSLLSGPMKFVQRVALHAKDPIDVAAAFASERYDTTLASTVIARATAAADREPA